MFFDLQIGFRGSLLEKSVRLSIFLDFWPGCNIFYIRSRAEAIERGKVSLCMFYRRLPRNVFANYPSLA